MRTIKGEIILPPDSPTGNPGLVIIEVRDISLADAPSIVVAERRIQKLTLKPKDRIRFEISVPEVPENRSLSLRVHISMDGSSQMKSGDLLTTAHYPVPSTGTPGQLEVATAVI